MFVGIVNEVSVGLVVRKVVSFFVENLRKVMLFLIVSCV